MKEKEDKGKLIGYGTCLAPPWDFVTGTRVGTGIGESEAETKR